MGGAIACKLPEAPLSSTLWEHPRKCSELGGESRDTGPRDSSPRPGKGHAGLREVPVPLVAQPPYSSPSLTRANQKSNHSTPPQLPVRAAGSRAR